MLEAFLVALREGVEAALVGGICLVYLRKISRRDLERTVWAGVAAALAASLAGAALLERMAWSQESVEGVLLLAAAALLVSMILWMRRVARSLRGQIEGEVGRLAGRARFATLGLFLFVFTMVLREGLETVIFLQAVALTSWGLGVLAGTLAGLGLAVALSVFFFRGTLPIRLDRFFEATSVMLIVIAVQLTLTGLHELSEAQILPSGPRMMRILGPIVRNEVFFLVILLAAAAGLVLRELARRGEGQERRWMTATALTAIAVLVALAAEHVYARGKAEVAPIRVEAAGDEVRIPLAWVNDGALHHFAFSHDGTSVRFFVLRRRDGRMATALEACSICGPHGYYQQGESIICGNCAAEFQADYVDIPGGCNPVRVESQVEGEELVIPVRALAGGARYFRAR